MRSHKRRSIGSRHFWELISIICALFSILVSIVLVVRSLDSNPTMPETREKVIEGSAYEAIDDTVNEAKQVERRVKNIEKHVRVKKVTDGLRRAQSK